MTELAVHVSVDMEGVAGVATRAQASRGGEDYPAARLLMTAEANAAVAGAFDGGATRVVVADAHGDMANLLVTELDPRAELVTGSPRIPWGMMQGIDDGIGLALFVGYHAAGGTPGGVLEHTYSSASFARVSVNDELWSETRLNAAIAGLFGVPVGLVTGDDLACEQAATLLPGVRTAVTKTALGRTSARSLHPERARDRIRAAAVAATRAIGELAPRLEAGPFAVEVELLGSAAAESCLLLPGSERTGARTVRVACPDITTVKQSVSCWIALAESTR